MSQTHELFGKYILLEKIQTGGMAEIYLARKPGVSGVSKFIAIKRILPQYSEQADFIEMFKDEAKIAVNLSHANIVSIHEFGMERSQFFIAMDFVEGRNLRQIINKMKKSGVSFSIEQILFIIKEVASGLDHAHRCIDANTGKPLNIIHRDMSPQNVMVSFEGEVKIVDFGIAKAETQIDSTRAGTLKGKFSYMSPEQAEGQAVDLRTDIFALGIVLWELLANDRLFVANNEMNTLRKVRDCQIPSLRKINPNIPPELERIVSKALAKDRTLRYQTAAAFQKELSRFLNRQYPDFSQHDFSVFVKTLFAAEILENRKKMVDYSKIELPPGPSSQSATAGASFRDATEITSATMTENTSSPDIEVPQAEIPQQPKRPAMRTGTSANGSAHSNSNSSSLSVERTHARDREVSYSSSVGGSTYYGNSQTNYRLKQPSSTPIVPMLLIAVGVIAGLAAVFPQQAKRVASAVLNKVQNRAPAELAEQVQVTKQVSETPTFTLRIDSIPSGAEVLIDGEVQSDTTPTMIKIPRNKEIMIGVRKTGFTTFEQKEKVDTNKQLSVPLQRERMGKLDINVVGAGQIYVNGKFVAPGSPANDIEVPADKDIIVRAEDPVTKASDEIHISVAENTTKKITLIPRHQQPRPQKIPDAPQKR